MNNLADVYLSDREQWIFISARLESIKSCIRFVYQFTDFCSELIINLTVISIYELSTFKREAE